MRGTLELSLLLGSALEEQEDIRHHAADSWSKCHHFIALSGHRCQHLDDF